MKYNQARRVLKREGLKHDGIDNAEDGSGGTDAEGEGEDGDGGEARVFAELANTVAAIRENGVKPIAKPTCPVCARRFSSLSSDLTYSQLHRGCLICRSKCTKQSTPTRVSVRLRCPNES
jgi:hypothetical protein